MNALVKRGYDGSFALACTSRSRFEFGVTTIISGISLKLQLRNPAKLATSDTQPAPELL
jgi:hypothetical protein